MRTVNTSRLLSGSFSKNIMKPFHRWVSLSTIKKTLDWWLRLALPVVAIALAAISIHDSGVQLELAQRIQEITISHYFEIEEPALTYQRISSDLVSLDEKIQQAEQGISQCDMPEASIIELHEALREAKYWREETDKALFEY